MATLVLVPGAGGNASYWAELVPQLEARRHVGIPVELLQDDPALGLHDYAATVDTAIGTSTDVVLVAQSLGGFVAPLISVPVRAIVLLCPMIPIPGEKLGDWWGATGSEAARTAAAQAGGYPTEFDLETSFFHDVPAAIRARMEQRDPPREPADAIFEQVCDFERWPEVPVHVLAGRDDRFFPLEFQRRVARERLGVTVDEIDGGHLVALSRAAELADRLVSYLA